MGQSLKDYWNGTQRPGIFFYAQLSIFRIGASEHRLSAVSGYSPGVIYSDAYNRNRPEGVIDDVFSVPQRLVQNFLKTHLMRLRLTS